MKNMIEREATVQVARTKLTQTQDEVLRIVTLKERVSISDTADRMQDVQALLSQGYLRLLAVVYPWGLDLQVEAACDRGLRYEGVRA